MENTLLDRVFRNNQGKIIIIQKPNLPIFIWTLASLLKLVFTTGRINLGLEMIAFASLFSWAWGELFSERIRSAGYHCSESSVIAAG